MCTPVGHTHYAYIHLDSGNFTVELDLTEDILDQIEKAVRDFDKRYGRCNRCAAFTKHLTDAASFCEYCDAGTMLCEECTNWHLAEIEEIKEQWRT